MIEKKLCFIGAGNMSSCITTGLVNNSYPANLICATDLDPDKLNTLASNLQINTSTDNLTAVKDADVIILCVKPQVMQTICEQLSHLDLSHKLIITIAAGIEMERYQSYFAQPIKLIRTMPNTPCQLGVGMTGLYAKTNINAEDKAIVEQLMSSCGETVWVEKESDINQVIALSGSSPAYFFLFMEAMIEQAKASGVNEDKARALVQQAALGSAQMVKQNPQLSIAQLRANVTSKGGTTAEAIATFEAGELRGLVAKAMDDCINRAEKMAKEF